jgi:hypothetical protein
VSWLSSLLHPGNPAADGANAQLAQQQKADDTAVTQGKSNIDSAFSRFTDPHFAGATKAYEDVYNQHLNDQYNTSGDQLTALLAGNDTLGRSSTGIVSARPQLRYSIFVCAKCRISSRKTS